MSTKRVQTPGLKRKLIKNLLIKKRKKASICGVFNGIISLDFVHVIEFVLYQGLLFSDR